MSDLMRDALTKAIKLADEGWSVDGPMRTAAEYYAAVKPLRELASAPAPKPEGQRVVQVDLDEGMADTFKLHREFLDKGWSVVSMTSTFDSSTGRVVCLVALDPPLANATPDEYRAHVDRELGAPARELPHRGRAVGRDARQRHAQASGAGSVITLAAAEQALATGKTRVKWSRYVRGSFFVRTMRGYISRATKSTLWVVEDRTNIVESMRLIKRIEGFDVELLSPHEVALEVWARAMPATRYVKCFADGLGNHLYETHARPLVHVEPMARDDEAERYTDHVATEAQLVRQWLLRRPTP
jgi:hypothetical protein